jgi:hypothetical protein
MGVHEGTEKVLAIAHYSRAALSGRADCLNAGIGSCAICIHLVLDQQPRTMSAITHEISIKGRKHQIPAICIDGAIVVTQGRLVRIAEIFDEYWLERDTLPNPQRIIEYLKNTNSRPDIFTFAQRVPDTDPRYAFHKEWDNVAVIPISNYDTWFREQITSASRRNIRASQKKGMVVKIDQFDEKYVRGIMSIYNESPIRAGRKFWHYGKDFAAVQQENGTYRERSTFLGAYVGEEMAGYMKIVWDTHSAAIMQILSKFEFRERRPNNALLSEAVKLCAERKIPHLLYERFVYGSKTDSSLTRFKRENGFVRMDLPRYYVPLTAKGAMAIKLRWYKDPKDMLPRWLHEAFVRIRGNWYASQAAD